MNSDIIVIFSSVTTATRVKNILLNNGIKACVAQTPKQISNRGCSYSVKTNYRALSILDDICSYLGVVHRGTYEIRGDQYYLFR